jgi:heptosyltransferase-2/heptosyltransferase-3
VAHHGAIGDLIQTTAMLQALHRRWGKPCDVLAGGSPAATVLAGLPAVGTVLTLSSTRRRPYLSSPEQWSLVRRLRQRGPSPCYVYERWRHPVAPWSDLTRLEWLIARAGVPRANWITTVDLERALSDHAVDYQLRLAALTPEAWAGDAPPIETQPPRPRLAVTRGEIAECRDWLKSSGWDGEPLILFQAAARRANVRGAWPTDRWSGLARAILERRPEASVLYIGGPSERRQVAELAAAVGDARARSVADDLPLRRLFALLTLADSCVSVDTGPAHAAAALDCPLVVLLGAAHPSRNRPIAPAGQTQLVAAWQPELWPLDAPYWYESHEMAKIPLPRVLEAWEHLEPRASRVPELA